MSKNQFTPSLDPRQPVRREFVDLELHSPSDLFHENSKLHPVSPRFYHLSGVTFPRETLATSQRDAHEGDAKRATGAAATVPEITVVDETDWKEYERFEQTPLDGRAREIPGRLADVLHARRSRRRFTGEPLHVEDLARLLPSAYGITQPATRYRSVPSGGALYPLEIYLLRFKGDAELPAGIFHYNIRRNTLERLPAPAGWMERAADALLNDSKLGGAAGVLVISAIFNRTRIKYAERGYRYVLFEAGHVMQNVCLLSEALGLAVYPIGGFIDDAMNRILGLDGKRETSLYCAVLGKR